MHCIVGLGSNLDDPVKQVCLALESLSELEKTVLIRQSGFYRSRPQGPQDQPDFVNASALIDTQLQPLDLLDALQHIEATQGRVKTRRWGERSIDMDIIFYGQLQMDHPRLNIPHPYALQRDFVVIPTLEIVPDWLLPDGSKLENHRNNSKQFILPVR